MLIDDRQIHSIDISKIIGLAKVGKTGSYSDLSNIPATFPPSEHTHPLATTEKAGFMSPEDFAKIQDLRSFKYLTIVRNETETQITASSYQDTLTLTAGKNIVFLYDEDTKNLTISIDYSAEEANLKGDKGDKGDKGKEGDIWRPTVNIDGYITFEINNSYTPPATVNIRGKQGEQGEKGKDAPIPTWSNLEGKPTGNAGDTIFVKTDNSNEITTGPILVEGMFPNSEEELNAYKLLAYNYEGMRDNWYRKYAINTVEDHMSESEASKYWDITADGFSYLKEDSGYNYILDHKVYNDYEIEVVFNNVILSGATGLVLASRIQNNEFHTLSFIHISHRDNYDLYPYENIFYNYAIVLNLGTSSQIVIDKLSLNESIYNGKEVKFKLKAIRQGDTITVQWTSFVLQEEEFTNYSDINKFTINLTSQSNLNRFMGGGQVGIGCINQIFENAIIYTQSDICNTIYPIYEDKMTKCYKCSPNDGVWKTIETNNVFTDIGVGRYIKDINSETLYYVKGDEVIKIKGTGPGDKMALINYTLTTPITQEFVN